MNEIVESVINEITIPNKALRTEHSKIVKLIDGTKKSLTEISFRLATVKTMFDNCPKEDRIEKLGFKDVVEFSEKAFGFKKSATYKFIKVAEKFLALNTDDNGKKVIESCIKHDNADYNVSQLIELNALEVDEVIELDENGTINPDMTAKEIRKTINETKEETAEETAEETTYEITEAENANEIDENEVRKYNAYTALKTYFENSFDGDESEKQSIEKVLELLSK